MKQNRKAISGVVITFNVADTIGPCLEAMKKVCDEVVVLDSFSTDGTVEICRNMGVRLIPQEWLGFAQTKNRGHELATHDWILSIDSDEILSDELVAAIQQLELSEDSVYSLDRLTNFCGKWIHHSGWYPEWKVRLFNKKRVKWQGDFVHETLAIPAGFSEVKVPGKLFHYSYKDKEDHLRRIKKYARLSAEERFANSKKASFVKLWLSPVARFFRTYFLKKGILDGREGLLISWRSACMVRLRYTILQELWRAKNTK